MSGSFPLTLRWTSSSSSSLFLLLPGGGHHQQQQEEEEEQERRRLAPRAGTHDPVGLLRSAARNRAALIGSSERNEATNSYYLLLCFHGDIHALYWYDVPPTNIGDICGFESEIDLKTVDIRLRSYWRNRGFFFFPRNLL